MGVHVHAEIHTTKEGRACGDNVHYDKPRDNGMSAYCSSIVTYQHTLPYLRGHLSEYACLL